MKTCGMRHVGRHSRKGSEWWSGEVGVAVAKKRKAFEEWLQRRGRDLYYRYHTYGAFVKQAANVAQKNGRLTVW